MDGILFYILRKCLNNNCIFSKVYYCTGTLFQGNKRSVDSVAFTSRGAKVLLFIAANGKHGVSVASNGITFVPSFVKIGQMVQTLK